MSNERIFDEAREQVRKIFPSHINITSIDFEGPIVVIYTQDMEAFASNNDIVRQLAQGLRKRVAIRPDPSMLADPDSVEKRIREIIPEDAQITDIYFEPETGEVTIEAMAPGLVIGKQGSVLNEIKKEVGWAPKVVRAPPIPSKTVSDIRNYLRNEKVQNERKDFLRKVGRRLARPKLEGESWIRMTALAATARSGVPPRCCPPGRARCSSTAASTLPTLASRISTRRRSSPWTVSTPSSSPTPIWTTAACCRRCTSTGMMARYIAPPPPAT
jgi:hypothetical protein